NISVCDEYVCLEMARMHEALLPGLPVGSVLQVLITIRPTHRAPAWEALRAGIQDEPLVDAQRYAIRQGLPHHAGPIHGRLREFSTLVTVRLPLQGLQPSAQALLRNLVTRPTTSGAHFQALMAGQLAASLDALESLGQGVEGTLRAAGHQVRRLDGL